MRFFALPVNTFGAGSIFRAVGASAVSGRESMMWKANFARLYLQHFPTLELIAERRVPYLEGENEDSMFLLAKKYS
jgi:hypothetical protein